MTTPDDIKGKARGIALGVIACGFIVAQVSHALRVPTSPPLPPISDKDRAQYESAATKKCRVYFYEPTTAKDYAKYQADMAECIDTRIRLYINGRLNPWEKYQ